MRSILLITVGFVTLSLSPVRPLAQEVVPNGVWTEDSIVRYKHTFTGGDENYQVISGRRIAIKWDGKCTGTSMEVSDEDEDGDEEEKDHALYALIKGIALDTAQFQNDYRGAATCTSRRRYYYKESVPNSSTEDLSLQGTGTYYAYADVVDSYNVKDVDGESEAYIDGPNYGNADMKSEHTDAIYYINPGGGTHAKVQRFGSPTFNGTGDEGDWPFTGLPYKLAYVRAHASCRLTITYLEGEQLPNLFTHFDGITVGHMEVDMWAKAAGHDSMSIPHELPPVP